MRPRQNADRGSNRRGTLRLALALLAVVLAGCVLAPSRVAVPSASFTLRFEAGVSQLERAEVLRGAAMWSELGAVELSAGEDWASVPPRSSGTCTTEILVAWARGPIGTTFPAATWRRAKLPRRMLRSGVRGMSALRWREPPSDPPSAGRPRLPRGGCRVARFGCATRRTCTLRSVR